MIIEFTPYKIIKPSELEKDKTILCILNYIEKGIEDGQETRTKRVVKSHLLLEEKVLNKPLRADVTITSWHMNGKSDYTIKLNKLLN